MSDDLEVFPVDLCAELELARAMIASLENTIKVLKKRLAVERKRAEAALKLIPLDQQ